MKRLFWLISVCLLSATASLSAQELKLGASLGKHGSCLVLAFSPDGKILASGCADGTLTFWDVRTLAKPEK